VIRELETVQGKVKHVAHEGCTGKGIEGFREHKHPSTNGTNDNHFGTEEVI
jgi:hypothetical protein